MMRGIEEWNRHAEPRARQPGNITTPGSDPYGGTGEWSFRRNARRDQGVLARRHPADEGAELRGRGHARHARQRRRRACPTATASTLMREHHRQRSAQILAEETGERPGDDPAGLDALQGGPALLGPGLRAARRRDRRLLRRQLGQHAQAARPGAAARAPAATACTTTSTTSAAAATTSGSTPSTCANIWEQLHHAYTYGVDRLWMVNVGDLKNEELPAAVLPRLRLGSRALAARAARRVGAAVRGAELRRRARRGDRRGPARRTASCSRAASRSCSTAGSPSTPPRTSPRTPTAVVYDDQDSPFSLTDYAEMDRVTARVAGASPRRPSRSATALPAALRRRLLPARLLPGEGDGQPVRAAPAAVHQHPLRRAGPGRHQRPRRRRPRPGSPRTRRCRAYYNTTLAGGKWNGLADAAEDRLRRRGAVRAERAAGSSPS